MTLEFLTPAGALLAFGVIVPLAAFLGVSRRAARVRRALGLPEPSIERRLVPIVAVLAVAGLLGLAAAQPLLQRTATRHVRADAEVLLVIDVSRSMLAQRSANGPTRLERAKAAAAELRASLPGVPVGIASLTNRVLPHLFPTGDEDVFRAALERTIDIGRPPPGSGFILTPEQQSRRNATSLSALSAVATQRFYSPAARHRLLVVLTDGESLRVSASAVGRRLRQAGIGSVFLHFWAANERVFTRGVPERQYLPIPGARSILDGLGAATRGSVYDEMGVEAAVQRARAVLGNGPIRVQKDERGRPLTLAPYLAAAVFLPLALLLWRRDR
ncbi:MAG: VWA domain-containing protein [Actinobacteria bacterium]|nr:VWA domain-containing protein [Actinomycetota bacterium]